MHQTSRTPWFRDSNSASLSTYYRFRWIRLRWWNRAF
nr:MAG TPA: hypothetical protein [Caudoviricetes sp.]